MKIIKIGAMWCPACIIMNKFWNRVKESFSDIEFIDYDLDMDEEEVNNYNPGNVLPVIIFQKDNLEVKRIVGEISYDKVCEVIKEVGNINEI